MPEESQLIHGERLLSVRPTLGSRKANNDNDDDNNIDTQQAYFP